MQQYFFVHKVILRVRLFKKTSYCTMHVWCTMHKVQYMQYFFVLIKSNQIILFLAYHKVQYHIYYFS